jgi:hypothetical protein
MKRVYHTWDKWECYPAGFYATRPPEGMTPRQAETLYRDLLRDIPRFESALAQVLTEWPRSCEHYLSNENMNRIAWLGQAAMCVAHGVSHRFRGGFNLLSADEKQAANEAALRYLNRWLTARGESTLESVSAAAAKTKQELY